MMISGRLVYSPFEDLNEGFRNATGISDGLAMTIENTFSYSIKSIIAR